MRSFCCAVWLPDDLMKRSTFWILGGLLCAALAAAGMRIYVQRGQPPTQAPGPGTAVQPTQAPLELAPADLVTVQRMALSLAVPVSGTLKASQTALVKARVAGELMDLTVREGDAVKAGQVLARIDPAEYEARVRQARQQADAAQSQVDIAQRQFDNNKALVDQGFISQTALQNSTASLAGARATHQAALAALDVARKALDDTVLRAPIAGQVSQRLSQPGERVAIEARIVELVNLSRLELEAALPAADAVQVRSGMRAQLQVEGREEPVNARVLRINPIAQAGSRSVLVYLGIDGEPGLRQGLFAEGRLGTRSVQALAVPLSSVRTDKPQPYVQVLEGDTVRHVPVQPGARTEVTQGQLTTTWVEVQGLEEGARVLAASAGALREGVRLGVGTAAR
jgi:RND family efflux transporter MFP subunit